MKRQIHESMAMLRRARSIADGVIMRRWRRMRSWRIWITLGRNSEKGQITASVYEDSPKPQAGGDQRAMPDSEAVDLVTTLGIGPGDAKAVVRSPLHNHPYRHQFKITSQQEADLRQRFFSVAW